MGRSHISSLFLATVPVRTAPQDLRVDASDIEHHRFPAKIIFLRSFRTVWTLPPGSPAKNINIAAQKLLKDQFRTKPRQSRENTD